MFHRSRSRLATGFTLSMGSILVLFAGILYLREAHDRLSTFDQTLYDTIRIMAAGVEDYLYAGQEQTDLENVPVLGSDALPLSSNLVFARWYTADRRLLQFMGEIPPSELTTPAGLQTVLVTNPLTIASTRLRQLTLPVYQDDRLIGYLQIAADLAPVEEPLQQLRLFLAVGVPLTLGAIALTGWVLGGQAMQPIRQSYEQLQQFTADASHELRAPLAGILSQAQVGIMEPIDPAEQTTRLGTIAEVAESMSALVGQLLFLARHEGNLPATMMQTVDLVPLLTQLADQYRPQAEAKQQTLIHDLPSDAVWIQGEADLLRQAIANLLSNAHRYTPPGGTIHLHLEQTSRWVTIQIDDTGIGIAPEALPRIFDRFYRADQIRSRQTGGFGLGLAIARQIIEAHSGTIAVQSVVEKGSCFQIRLPVV